MTLAAEPLNDEHDLDGFSCGNSELDRWLTEHALSATVKEPATYVLVDPPAERVLGYFAVAPHLVRREDLAAPFGRGMPRIVPVILLAKLALDQGFQGSGLGSELLVRALRTIVIAARSAGGKLVVVDAIDDEAIGFYREHGFTAIPGDDRRLVHKLSTVAKELDIEWP